MSDSQEPLPYAELMPAIYRFAFLMTGSSAVAAQVLQSGVERAGRTLRQIRDAGRARRWLFSQARLDCAAANLGAGDDRCRPADDAAPAPPAEPVPAIYNDPAQQLALVFAVLPEPERCALALFYLYLFTPAELREIMEIKPQVLGALLSQGRALLQRDRVLCSEILANPVSLTV